MCNLYRSACCYLLLKKRNNRSVTSKNISEPYCNIFGHEMGLFVIYPYRTRITFRHKAFLASPIQSDTISIILTFGTAYFVDKNKKENAKLEIAKMIIFDMDQTIKKIESTDSLSKVWANEFLRHVNIVNKARKQYQE